MIMKKIDFFQDTSNILYFSWNLYVMHLSFSAINDKTQKSTYA